jgi:chromosome segregation ATPase
MPGGGGAMMSAEEMKQRVDEFGDRLQQLQSEEVEACQEWLHEIENRHERLKSALEEYIKWLTMAGEQMLSNYQNLREYVSDWAELTTAFNRVFNKGQEKERQREKVEEIHRDYPDAGEEAEARDGKAYEEPIQ